MTISLIFTILVNSLSKFLNFSIISYLNLSIKAVKGVGFVPKEEFLEGMLIDVERFMKGNPSKDEVIRFLLEYVYDETRIDFGKLSSIELVKGHTYQNLAKNPKATLMFFVPPSTSFEVRCGVEIHKSGVYHKYVNSLHDLFHKPEKTRDWSKTPVYIFKIEEIYDNSIGQWGVKIY